MATATIDGLLPHGATNFSRRLRRARLGLSIGVLAIVMVFVSFTSAYVVRQGLPTLDPRTDTLVRDWLPLPLPGFLLFNTFVLLLSTVTVELARRRVRKSLWLGMTLLLGSAFLTCQWVVWRDLAARGYYLATGPSSAFLYLLTGMHGIHLLGGILALLVAGALAALRRPLESRAVVLDITAWYWHFMTLLWLYILCLLEFA